MSLDDPALAQLENLILDTFRVHENQVPIYVDVGGNLNRIASGQHQVIFGRRGSGKSCLLIHYKHSVAPGLQTLAIYLNADEIKLLRFPDILIRTLVTLFDGFPDASRRRWLGLRPRTAVQAEIDRLRKLLDEPEHADVTEEASHSRSGELGVEGPTAAGAVRATQAHAAATTTTRRFGQAKIDFLERHLQDFKKLIRESLEGSGYTHATFLIDDLYLIRRSDQPDFIDYLHRLLRGTKCYLKIGTIRHRTTLLRQDGHPIGVELSQDVEGLNLDRTLEDVPAAQSYLSSILDEMAKTVGIGDVVSTYLNPDAALALTIASGGVPRDFLNIFVEALRLAREHEAGGRWITPRDIYKGAARHSYRTKISNLRTEAGPEGSSQLELLFQDLLTFCLHEKGKTAFLISQAEAGAFSYEHELLQQLMDFKLIHAVEADTSAASGREGRFEAYTLDAASFMHPRRRNIEIVEFWKFDDQRRPLGLRESPTYPLSRARAFLRSGAIPELDRIITTDIEAPAAVD